MIYIDESGSSRNWKSDFGEQPFYVLSAVSFESKDYGGSCENLRNKHKQIFSEKAQDKSGDKILGLGHEIKAKEIFANKGWWKTHTTEKEAVLQLMLDFPEQAWIAVLDKKKHFNQYSSPDEPLELCMKFLFERIQWYLKGINDTAVCVFDQNKKLDEYVYNKSADLIKNGAVFQGWDSNLYKFKMDKILECHVGNSKNSLGLMSADFFATGAYQYYKKLKSNSCDWWNLIGRKLYCKNGEYMGYGLKEFP